MTTTLATVDMSRGASRVRLVFSAAMAAGAFTSTSYYAVTSTDSLGPNPTVVVAVFAVSGASNIVELAVEPALAAGSVYSFAVTAAPAADASTVTGSLPGSLGLGPVTAAPNLEPQQQTAVDLILYDRDYVFDGNDLSLTATGDLATITGRQNWLGAIRRRETSDGLPWDLAYGPRASDYVNAPAPYRLPLAGRMVAQARADNRTKKATCTVQPFAADASGNGWLFVLAVVGKDGLDPSTIEIPPSAVGA